MDDELRSMLLTIVREIHSVKDDVQELKAEVRELKEDVRVLKEDVRVLKEDVRVLKEDVRQLDVRLTRVELNLENVTNKNIQILAENHLSLIDKLNQSIKAAEKNMVYEIQVDSLKTRVDKLENECKEIKSHIA